ncbi:hypothetical protein [Amycolatopsis sp. Hca4]|uniref:hypothetical protein n=1 Tax=Amycolatopsis sp. Hca4 TaxID=2742131 RepID=UPI0015906A8D|nr:hypothetical protein [Amycolatopsis sp. Hca4]QKV80474.1 hypothetical protein HUT10_46880 [Amycolatopsis sp. Hca4]
MLTTALLLGFSPAAIAASEGSLSVQPARGATGAQVEVRIVCPEEQPFHFRPLLPVESTALAVSGAVDPLRSTADLPATVRTVPPGRYSVSVRCEGRGGNGLIAYRTLTTTFTVVPKTTAPSTPPPKKPQVPRVPRGGVATGDGTFSAIR